MREIERAVGVSRSTAALWVRDIELTSEQREHLRVRPRGVRTDFRRRRVPYGTCRMTVCDVRIAQHLYGAIQEHGEFERPEWLG